MFRSETETKELGSKRFLSLIVLRKLVVLAQGMIDGPAHTGGILPPGTTDPGISRIASRGRTRIESLAANWGHYQFSIPAEIEKARIELETAKSDLVGCEEVLAAHRAEYRRTHRGLDPPATGFRSERVGFWGLAAVFTVCEMPLASAAFAVLPISDWERLVATLGASAVTIALSHEIGVSFARPAKTIGQRLVGWVLVIVLAVILAGMSAVRTEAIKGRMKAPLKSTPEVWLQLPEKGEVLHG
jgi:hypothetical protein